MKIHGKAQAQIEKLVEQFQSGDIFETVQKSVIISDDIPSAKWTILNRIMAMSQCGDSDCRGFRQWESVGRYVKKGEHCAYILRPIYVPKKKDQKNEDEEEEENSTMKLIGFSSVPVFGVSQTEGKPLEYGITDSKELPALMEVAQRLGIPVDYDIFFINQTMGTYFPESDKIKLCTTEESTFLHELSHAVHQRVCGKLKNGQHPSQEIIAEFSGCILARMYGKKTVNENNSYFYIKRYADKIGKDVPEAILTFLTDIVKVIDFIIDTKESIAKAA